MNNKQSNSIFRPVLLFTTIFEGITAGARFGLNLNSTRDTASTIGRLTMGIRIHHGYIGLSLVLIAFLAIKNRGWQKQMYILGWSLFFSDMAHHFLVLWPITGSPEFDLTY